MIETTPQRRVPPALDTAAAYAWHVIVIAIVVVASLWLLREMRVVAFPVVVALFLCRALWPVAEWLRNHRWRSGLASIASMLGLFVLVGTIVALAVPSIVDEVDSIRPTLTEAIDDIENWLVEDAPIQVSRESVDKIRERGADAWNDLLQSSEGGVADRATLIAEAIAGAVLAVILTFFMLRDGPRFVAWASGRAGQQRQPRLRKAMDAAWTTLGGYLRGATLLGAVEAVVIGLTLWIAGGSLIAPVMVITFLGAYIPLVGAVVAGVMAVLVALVTAGTGGAIAVAVVALIVQQLDNDLLAPIIYGRALKLHPVVILLSVAAGGALFGITGAVLAVPAVAVGINGSKAYRNSVLAA